jgi:hypothetical protein
MKIRKIYILHHSYHVNRYTWEKEIEEIKSVKPDLILCLCLEEFDYSYIYGLFFDGIAEWVNDNNTPVKVLVSSPDKVELYPNIYTESTCGYYAWFEDCLNKPIPTSDMPTDKVFTCYNNNNKFERAVLVDELARRNLLQHGVVTWKFPDIGQMGFEYRGSRKFQGWKYHDGSRLVDEEDFELNSSEKYFAGAYPNSYFRGFFDLVTESVCYPEQFFCTEKTAKSINALKPFICLANPLYHTKYLVEEYGLELYDELFDYDFDKIHDLDKRIHALVDNVERIAQVYSEQYKDNMLQTIHSKMVRNKQKLTDYGKSKENIVPKSFEFLFNNAVPYTTYGHTHYLQQYIDYYISKGWL